MSHASSSLIAHIRMQIGNPSTGYPCSKPPLPPLLSSLLVNAPLDASGGTISSGSSGWILAVCKRFDFCAPSAWHVARGRVCRGGEGERGQRMSPLLLHVAAFMAICRVSPIIMTNRFTAPPDLALFHVTFAHGMDSIKSKDPTPFPSPILDPGHKCESRPGYKTGRYIEFHLYSSRLTIYYINAVCTQMMGVCVRVCVWVGVRVWVFA